MKRRDRARRSLPSPRRAALAALLCLPLALPFSLALGSCAGGASAPPERRGEARAALSTGMIAASSPMIQGRSGHTATLLPSGKVLLAGGRADEADKGRTAEIYDPATGRTVATTHPMNAARSGHTATLLPSGEVLLAGGASSIDAQNVDAAASAELYDPATDRFRALAAPLRSARADHTATLLPGGKVLLAGGSSGVALADEISASDSPRAEIYDPATEAFTATKGGMIEPRSHHTATLLPGGKVLLVGGDDDSEGSVAAGKSAELYDAASDAFVASAHAPLHAFSHHAATLLPGGAVLLTGGLTRPLPDGGRDESEELRQAELYDPLEDRFSITASLARFRADHSATLLPSGRVLLVGGTDDAGASLEIFDPATATFLSPEDLPATRAGGHTATLLPSGAVLVTGGSTLVADTLVTSSDTLLYDDTAGGFTQVGDAKVSRVLHTATLLLDGEVLITGGAVAGASPFFPAAELYAPGDNQIRPASPMRNLRAGHSATLLTSGDVLIAGGVDQSGDADGGPSLGALDSAELYRPDDGRFLLLPSMHAARSNHSATLLPSGEVLIAGGSADLAPTLQRAELFDPFPRLFFALSSPMQSPRSAHVAALLRSGEVLLAGGYWGADALRSAEIYDPRTRSFRPTGTMHSAHGNGAVGGFTATLLASGKVLFVGLDAAELFDPDADAGAGAFVPAAVGHDEPAHRNGHSATLLPSGKVLITGGTDESGAPLSSAALYDPTSDRFLAQSTLVGARAFHTATLLPSGEVFVAGGFDNEGIVSAHEHWDEQLPDDRLLPHLTEVPRAPGGEGALLQATQLLGPLETGGGASNGSATNLPVALWLPMAGGLTTGTLHDIEADSARWTFPAVRLTGPGLLFLAAAGRRGEGVPLVLGQDLACRSNADCPDGQACSSAGACGDPVTAGPPATGCRCAEAGAPQSPWSAALAAAAIGLFFARRRAISRRPRR